MTALDCRLFFLRSGKKRPRERNAHYVGFSVKIELEFGREVGKILLVGGLGKAVR